MTINELHIQLDLYLDDKIHILKNIAREFLEGYLFVDSSDGHFYFFDRNGNEDDIKKIKNIESNTFCHDQSLKSIVIPDSVEDISSWAFECCENLESVVIPNSVKYIGYKVFSHCKNLKLIKIPNSVENIAYYVFWNCKSLKSLSFKGKTLKQVKEMKSYPFGIEDESIIRCI